MRERGQRRRHQDDEHDRPEGKVFQLAGSGGAQEQQHGDEAARRDPQMIHAFIDAISLTSVQ